MAVVSGVVPMQAARVSGAHVGAHRVKGEQDDHDCRSVKSRHDDTPFRYSGKASLTTPCAGMSHIDNSRSVDEK
jgi:hypothetical protein